MLRPCEFSQVPFLGFGHTSLPTDPHRYTVGSSTRGSVGAGSFEKLTGKSRDTFEVVLGHNTDTDGWMYALDFVKGGKSTVKLAHSFSPKRANTFVRKRLWRSSQNASAAAAAAAASAASSTSLPNTPPELPQELKWWTLPSHNTMGYKPSECFKGSPNHCANAGNGQDGESIPCRRSTT